MKAGEILALLKDAYKGWSDDKASRLAAALAFYTIFAIAPLLIIVIEIGAALLGGAGHHHVVRDQILNQLRPAIGDSGTKAIGDVVQATFDQRRKGVLASVVGWIIFAVAATGLVLAIQDALDTVWDARGKTGIFNMIVDRLKSFAVIGGAAVLVVLMSFATAFVNTIGGSIVARIVNAIIGIVVAIVLTAAIYKWLPKVELTWKDVIVGATISAILSIAGQYLIGLYLSHTATGSAFGAAGSLVAVLIWLDYSAQIFLFGAEITKAYANRFGSRIRIQGTLPTTKGSVAASPVRRPSTPSTSSG